MPAITDPYTGPTMAQIQAMQNDGIQHNYAEAMAALNAWKASHPGIDPFAPVPTPLPALPPVPAPTTPVPAGPTWDQQVASARAKAEETARLYITQQGLDPATYLPMVDQELSRIQGNLLPTDDPSTAFGSDIAQSILTGQQNTQRNQFMNSVEGAFNPTTENTAVPSSLLDDAINKILGTQSSSAQDYLDRGLARGIYNDVGYNAGETALANDTTMGRSDLSSLGSSVIDKYRTQLEGVHSNAYDAASGYTLGGNFSLDPYKTEFSDIANRANTNAEGDLRNLVGGRNYYDFSALTGAAGQAQGALNLKDTDVATALAERNRKNMISRGLGSQGAF